jgi:UDPglucose--hexose-1-phosphate uridylyltransferase
MPELRRDPVAGRWVVIATDRAARPHQFQCQKRVPKGGFCPFCEGNEAKTPPEVMAYRRPGTQRDTPGWRVRVVPNKYPALHVEGELHMRGLGVYDTMEGIGAHEVLIESPRHILSPTEAAPGELEEVVRAYRDRMLDLRKDIRLVCAMLFKNVGAEAGASLEHSHSQLICTPVVPKRVQEEMDRCNEFYRFRGRCLLCDIIQQDLADGQRVVMDKDDFVVLAPYAARFPFEMWILPKRHVSHFEDIPDDMVGGLARALHEALCRLDASLDQPAYNYNIHSVPFALGPVPYYHWHVEVIPRVTAVAGFEWGSGFYINPVPPETAAHYLRDVAWQREPAKVQGAPA